MSSVSRSRGVRRKSSSKPLKVSLNASDKKALYKAQHDTCMTKSHKMYQDLVEMAHEGIAVTDPDDNLTYINRQFAKSLGYTISELTGKNVSLIATDWTMKRIKEEGKKRRRGIKSRYEIALIHKDGSLKHYWLSVRPMYGAGRQFLGAMGVFSDVTEKKSMELRLKRKVKQIDTLYRVYEHARMDKRISAVLKGIVKEVIRAFPSRRDAYSRLILDDRTLYYPEALDHYHHKIEIPLVIAGRERGSLTVGYSRFLSDFDGVGSLQEEAQLMRNVAQILCKHMQARDVLNRYWEIIKKSFTAIVIISGNTVEYVNPRFYRMFKCRHDDVIGADIRRFLPSYNAENCVSAKVKECRGKRSKGLDISLAMITQTINYHGKSSVLIRLNDISPLKKAQARLRNFNHELQRQVKEKTYHLEQANRRLQSLNQLKDEFIAVTSHELRSPLTSIRGYLSFLTEEEAISQLSDPYREYLIRAYSTTDALNYLINNILDVSRLDMGRFELQRQETDIIRLVRNILDSLSFQMNERKLQLEFENLTDREHLTLKIDSIRMSQVLRNILDNSIKFTKRGNRIRVLIKIIQKKLLIVVSDEGVGIPTAKLEQIFDKFTQVKTTQTKYKGGVGLGLFIAKRIVELHGGTIKASKNNDKGTTIKIGLPLETNEKDL